MTTYSPGSQMNFLIQWFKSWSDFQKDDFVPILAQKVSSPEQVNGIVNGLQKLDLDVSGRPPSLFACQVKLFTEWWDTWGEADRQKMTDLLKEADPKFWETVESELKGTRVALNEDFMVVTDEGEQKVMNGGAKVTPPPVFNVKQILPGGGGSDGEGRDSQDEPSGGEEVEKDVMDPMIQTEAGDEGAEV